MEACVKIMNVNNGKGKVLYTCKNAAQASHIVQTFNRLNEEAAKMTGQAIKFVYAVVFK